MAQRYFINLAPTTNISPGITSGAPTCSASSFTGWPTSYPFTATLDYGLATAEVVLVTNIAGTVATITRGYDNTVAVAHASGATFDCTPVAKDFQEANSHVNASTGVHSVSGAVVGTSDVQTLTNKTLGGTTTTGPVNTTGNVTASGTVQGATVTATGQVNAATSATTGASTAASYTATAGVSGATVTASGAVSGATANVSGTATVGSLSSTGAVSGSTVTATTTVTGSPVPKSYTNEAAASAAISTVGAVVKLTAPTTAGYGVGLYEWTGTVWHPLPGGVMGTVSTATSATSTGATEVLFAGLSLPLAGIVAGRNYRVVWGCLYRVSVANTNAAVVVHASQSAITTGSPTIGGVGKWVQQISNGPEDVDECLWTPGASGAWNLEVGVKATSGTGNAQVLNGVQNAFLTVYAA